MRSLALHRLQSLWPFWVPALAFLAGLAGGLAGGVLAFTLTFLVVGPAYLARRWWLGGSGRISAPEPKTPAEQARFLKAGVVVNLLLAAAILAAAAVGSSWLPGGGWSALVVLAAVCSIGSAPAAWTAAVGVETGGTPSRRALAVGAAVEAVVGLALLGFAATNLAAGWLGGWWTLGAAALGAFYLLGAAASYARRSTS